MPSGVFFSEELGAEEGTQLHVVVQSKCSIIIVSSIRVQWPSEGFGNHLIRLSSQKTSTLQFKSVSDEDDNSAYMKRR